MKKLSVVLAGVFAGVFSAAQAHAYPYNAVCDANQIAPTQINLGKMMLGLNGDTSVNVSVQKGPGGEGMYLIQSYQDGSVKILLDRFFPTDSSIAINPLSAQDYPMGSGYVMVAKKKNPTSGKTLTMTVLRDVDTSSGKGRMKITRTDENDGSSSTRVYSLMNCVVSTNEVKK